MKKGRVTHPLLKQIRVGGEEQRLKSTPTRKSKESPLTPLEKAVMSRRPVFEQSADKEVFPEQEWETEGSGVAGYLVERLYVSLRSIRAGNSSTKLQRCTTVRSLLDSLVRVGAINEKQKKKTFVII